MNAYEVLLTSCQDEKVSVDHIRSVLFFSTNFLFLPATGFFAEDRDGLATKAELCKVLSSITMSDQDMQQYRSNLTRMMFLDQQHVQHQSSLWTILKSLPGHLSRQQRKLRQFKQMAGTVSKFRNLVLEHMPHVLAIHFFRPDGTPRQTIDEILRAMLYYPLSDNEARLYLAFFSIAIVTITAFAGYQLYQNKFAVTTSIPNPERPKSATDPAKDEIPVKTPEGTGDDKGSKGATGGTDKGSKGATDATNNDDDWSRSVSRFVGKQILQPITKIFGHDFNKPEHIDYVDNFVRPTISIGGPIAVLLLGNYAKSISGAGGAAVNAVIPSVITAVATGAANAIPAVITAVATGTEALLTNAITASTTLVGNTLQYGMIGLWAYMYVRK